MKKARLPSTSSAFRNLRVTAQQLPAELVLVDETGVLREAEQVIQVSLHYGYRLVVIGPDDEEHTESHSYQHSTQQVESKYVTATVVMTFTHELVPALAGRGESGRKWAYCGFVSHSMMRTVARLLCQGRQAEHPGSSDHRSQEKQSVDDGGEACAPSGLDVGSGAHDDGRDGDAADQFLRPPRCCQRLGARSSRFEDEIRL